MTAEKTDLALMQDQISGFGCPATMTSDGGSLLVISKNNKNYNINLNGKQSRVSTDLVKPGYVLADNTNHPDQNQSQSIIKDPTTTPPTPSI
ncbi:hypothetical protein AVEN_264587-1 [Araneus ventricosus]|uniref:Uncharacterized protein n=1 Tax=Araneus ventricosus TaxID=182803 RepID=A0A4Y2LYV5_ARAVE|nr:hypothetical protein AVEN_264587-1 [Araneus ventricosus]